MNLLKRLLGHIYFFYGMIVFAITLVLEAIAARIALFFEEPKRAKILHVSFNIWMRTVLPLLFIRVKRTGKENFKKGETYVITPNHNSFVDILVSSPWIPEPNKTLAKIELSKIPVFGTVYKSGSILVDRKSEQSRKESFSKMQETLNMGLHLCLYPEGTRNKTNDPVGKFKDGAFIVAIRNQKAIIPTVITGTKNILPERPKFWAWPHSVHIHFMEPIPTKGMSLSQKNELMEQVRQLISDYYVKHNRD